MNASCIFARALRVSMIDVIANVSHDIVNVEAVGTYALGLKIFSCTHIDFIELIEGGNLQPTSQLI